MRPRTPIFTALALVLINACTATGTTADRTADSAAAAAASSVASDTDPATVRRTIEAANARYVDALKRADTTGAAAYYADDAVSLPQNQEARRGHAAIAKGLGEDARAMRVTDAKFTTEDVMVGGDLAVETGAYDITLQRTTGEDIKDNGKYITVWKRQPDGSWKIVRDIYNSNPAGRP